MLKTHFWETAVFKLSTDGELLLCLLKVKTCCLLSLFIPYLLLICSAPVCTPSWPAGLPSLPLFHACRAVTLKNVCFPLRSKWSTLELYSNIYSLQRSFCPRVEHSSSSCLLHRHLAFRELFCISRSASVEAAGIKKMPFCFPDSLPQILCKHMYCLCTVFSEKLLCNL